MKDKYRTMMENLTISPGARNFIESRIVAAPTPAKRARPLRPRALTAIAASFAVVLLLFTCPIAAEALKSNAFIAKVIDTFGFTSAKIEYESPEGSNIIIAGVDENGDALLVSHYEGGCRPFWLTQEDDRLYFVGGGVKIDITDQFDDEIPFTYVFTDEDQIIHHIAVGGRFNPVDPEDSYLGWADWMKAFPGTNDSIARDDGWISAYAFNLMNCEDETKYPWYEKAEELHDSPWKTD